MVQVENAVLTYGNGVQGLKGVNLKVDDGEFCFITGKSGSGKSSLSKILTGEMSQSAGMVKVNGYQMGALDRKTMAEARRTIGMVFQDFRLITSMNVEQNLEFAMRCINAPVSNIDRRIEEVLDLVSLSDKRYRMPAELSGGEQQRVAIARAIINRPKILIADEPTGNLDPAMAKEIMGLFVEFNETMETTTLVITHAQDLVDMYQKRVITLGNGFIINDTGENAMPQPALVQYQKAVEEMHRKKSQYKDVDEDDLEEEDDEE